jgi:hypothetical protein
LGLALPVKTIMSPDMVTSQNKMGANAHHD